MELSPVELRHILHKNPETAYSEFATTKTIIDSIKALPGAEEAFKFIAPLETGVLIEYTVNNDEYLLFRADIDALLIKEQTDWEYGSLNQNMHACGHDVHTSSLYGLIKYVLENKIKRNLLFLFQPAEESGGGAMRFFDTGIFDNYKIKNAFALHVTDEYDKGIIGSTSGVLFASALELNIDFTGVSAHVAFPQNGKNALSALRLFMDAADKLPRNIGEPSIIGMGKIAAGDVRNIAPGWARLEGSIRALSVEKANAIFNKLQDILKGVELQTGVNSLLQRLVHYPEVIVNADLFKKYEAVLSQKYKFIDCSYKMTGGGFGLFSRKYPSFMFWLGTSTGERYGLHNPHFLPDDSIVNLAVSIWIDILNNS